MHYVFHPRTHLLINRHFYSPARFLIIPADVRSESLFRLLRNQLTTSNPKHRSVSLQHFRTKRVSDVVKHLGAVERSSGLQDGAGCWSPMSASPKGGNAMVGTIAVAASCSRNFDANMGPLRGMQAALTAVSKKSNDVQAAADHAVALELCLLTIWGFCTLPDWFMDIRVLCGAALCFSPILSAFS